MLRLIYGTGGKTRSVRVLTERTGPRSVLWREAWNGDEHVSAVMHLVLMSQREAEGRARLLNFAAQLITVTLEDNGTLAERMAKSFPWMLALSSADRATCAQELVDAARASFATDQPHLAIAELTSWKETAAAIAAGLHSVDVDWLDGGNVAQRP